MRQDPKNFFLFYYLPANTPPRFSGTGMSGMQIINPAEGGMNNRNRNRRGYRAACGAVIHFYWLIITVFFFLIFNFALAVTSQELKEEINQKSAELLELAKKRQETEKTLDVLEGKNKSLKQELKKINYAISQLNLSVKAGEINLEKIGLEISAIDFDINDIQKRIGVKKEAIAQIVRGIQREDADNFLVIILRHKSLAASVAEAQSLLDFNSGLTIEVGELKDLRIDLVSKLDEMNRKKIEKEFENRNLKNRRIIALNEKENREILFDQTKNQEKLYQRQLTELEKKQTEISAEIAEIEEELRASLDPSLLPLPRPGALAIPLEDGRVTQKFGTVSRLYGGKPHNGLDLASFFAASVTAAEKGKVLLVYDQDKFCYRGAYGKLVLIEHENNLTTLYAHLSKYAVKEGDIINRGDLIGYAGRSGYATGPHLHFGVYASQTVTIRQSRSCGKMPFGAPLDPQNYL